MWVIWQFNNNVLWIVMLNSVIKTVPNVIPTSLISWQNILMTSLILQSCYILSGSCGDQTKDQWSLSQGLSPLDHQCRFIVQNSLVTNLSTQRATRVMMEAYSDTTSTNLWNLHSATPSNQPLFIINNTISGTPNNMMSKSARARFMMKRLVTERLIFLSDRMMKITRALPISPVKPGE